VKSQDRKLDDAHRHRMLRSVFGFRVTRARAPCRRRPREPDPAYMARTRARTCRMSMETSRKPDTPALCDTVSRFVAISLLFEEAP
jgi:hypothetical protein